MFRSATKLANVRALKNYTLHSTQKCLFSSSTCLHNAPLTLVEEKERVRYVTLNNPKKRNALSLALMESLLECITKDTSNINAVVLKANGPVFSAGHDLRELRKEAGSEFHQKVFDKCTQLMKSVQDVPIPVIVQVSLF